MTRQQLIKDGENLGCPNFMRFLADSLGLSDEFTPSPLRVAES